MKIGEIVEVLIRVKDNGELTVRETQAVIEACNVLEKLPRLEEAVTYNPEQI